MSTFVLRKRMKEKGYVTPRGLDVDRLGRESGVNFATVRNLLREKTQDPTARTLIPIARALGMTVEELFEEDTEAETPAIQLQAA